MSEIKAGDFRICASCGSRNKAAYNFCVRCSALMDAAPAAPSPASAAVRAGNTRLTRFLLAAGVMVAIIAGLMVRTVFKATLEVPAAVSDDARADGGIGADATVAPVPPPAVTGWVPGASAPAAPEAAPAQTASGWSGASFPAARPNPYDVPGDPGSSMVGIAPSGARPRGGNRRRVFTEADLVATRGGTWSTPPPASGADSAPESEEVAKRTAKLGEARSRLDAAEARLGRLRAQGRDADDDASEALDDAEDDVEDARKDADKAARKLDEARRN